MTEKDAILGLVSAVSGDSYLKVEETLGDGYVRLKISEAERRQAKHDIRGVEDVVVELLRNSRDAHAHRVFVATAREGDTRTLTVVDDGVGIPENMHEAVFEPRVTSKLETMVMDRWGVHGRGMALFSVRSNVESARIAASDAHKGTALAVSIHTVSLPEKTDQSTWPAVETGEDGRPRVVRGPHNMVRRVVEFACEHPELDIFFGSPTEVVATLHDGARTLVDSSDLLFCDDAARLPVWQRPAIASDASELVSLAASIGLPVSERTAHRVLAGEMSTLAPVAQGLGQAEEPAPAAAPDIYRDRRGLKLHHTDVAELKQGLHKAFDPIAERYYLHLKGEPKVTVTKDRIRVTFEVEKDD